MAQKQPKLLTNLELRLMKIVWDKGKATVKDVKDAVPRRRPLAYTTVLTVMRILERKGFVRHDAVDRTYVYYPVVTREEVVRSTVRDLIHRLFNGSAELLMANILDKEELTLDELERLRRLVTERKNGAKQRERAVPHE
jgi:predicted transcriptional regulator